MEAVNVNFCQSSFTRWSKRVFEGMKGMKLEIDPVCIKEARKEVRVPIYPYPLPWIIITLAMFHKVLLVVFAAFTLASAIPLGKFFFILWRPDTEIDVRDNELDAAALYKEAKADVVINSRGLSGCTVYNAQASGD